MGIAVPGDVTFLLIQLKGEKPLFTQHEIAKVACGGPRRLCSFPSKVDRAAAGPRRGKQEVFSSVHAAKASSSAGSGGVRERQAASVNESKDETRKRKKAGRGEGGSSEPAIFFTSLSIDQPPSAHHVPVA
jgi:hypothetical protein